MEFEAGACGILGTSGSTDDGEFSKAVIWCHEPICTYQPAFLFFLFVCMVFKKGHNGH